MYLSRFFALLAVVVSLGIGAYSPYATAFVGSRPSPESPFLLMNAAPSPEEITHHSLGSKQRYLATGDSAGVITIWDVDQARISRRIYLPFFKDLAGNGITALHLQSQGNLLAVSAKTSLGGQTDSYRVLVFDITTGTIQANLPANKLVQQVGFSPNGRWLAIQESQGDLALFDTTTWQEKKRLANQWVSNYSAPKEIVVWGDSGNLYAMSNSYGYGDRENIAFVRRINPETSEVSELLKQSSSIPFRLALSPNERFFALYYRDKDTWQRLLAPIGEGERHFLGTRCGSFSWEGTGSDFVCGTQGYRLTPGQSPIADNTVVYHSVKSRVQVTANLVRFNEENGTERASFHRAIISDTTLRADNKLQTLLFRLQGKDYTFHLPSRRLKLADDTAKTLQAASPSNAAIQVESWKGSWDTTVNGNKLKELSSYPGGSKLVDVLPDGSGIIVGTSYWYVRYDTAGNKIWEIRTKDNPFAHKVAADSHYFVALFSDGILRWYRVSDGQLLLSLYVQGDNPARWVIWTPSGYYDAAPGAEEFIGWHVNRGSGETAAFYPASRFRERFYRPDVIDQLLETLDEGQAIARADTERGKRTQPINLGQVLPPSIELLSPTEGTFHSDKLSIRLQLRSATDAPITALRVRVNGQVVETRRDLAVVGSTNTDTPQNLEIPLPRQDAEIQVFAENRHGVSPPVTLRYRYVGSLMPSQVELARPKLYVLAIGVSDYDNPNYRLNLAAKDAKDVSEVFTLQKNKLYRDVEVRLLMDKAASRDGIMDGLEWLQRQVTARDVGVLFLAGHGINAPDGAYYFAPVNFNIESIKRTGVVFNEIKMTLSSLAGKAVFFVDTCHSGNILGAGRRTFGSDITGIINELSSAENGVVVFSSATGREYALEKPEWGNGAFTKAVVEGLSGKADLSGSGRITHKGLDYYISERVKVLTNGQQHPVTQAPGGVPDFPLAITR